MAVALWLTVLGLLTVLIRTGKASDPDTSSADSTLLIVVIVFGVLVFIIIIVTWIVYAVKRRGGLNCRNWPPASPTPITEPQNTPMEMVQPPSAGQTPPLAQPNPRPQEATSSPGNRGDTLPHDEQYPTELPPPYSVFSPPPYSPDAPQYPPPGQQYPWYEDHQSDAQPSAPSLELRPRQVVLGTF